MSSNAENEAIDEPGVNDVMLGRGAGTNRHPGNKTFRNICKEFQEKYIKAINNYEKYLITMEIMERIQNLDPPGRFIDKDSKKGKSYYDVGEVRARKKISQALRENAPEIKKKKDDKESPEKIESKPTQKEKDLVEEKMKHLRVNLAEVVEIKDEVKEQPKVQPKVIITQPKVINVESNAFNAQQSVDLDNIAAFKVSNTQHSVDLDNIAATRKNISVNDLSMDIKKSLNLSEIFEDDGSAKPDDMSMFTSVGTFALDDHKDMNYSLNMSNFEHYVKKKTLDNSIALETAAAKAAAKPSMDLSTSMLDIENSVGTFVIDETKVSTTNHQKIIEAKNLQLEKSIALDTNLGASAVDMFEVGNSIGTFALEDVSGHMSLSQSATTIDSKLD